MSGLGGRRAAGTAGRGATIVVLALVAAVTVGLGGSPAAPTNAATTAAECVDGFRLVDPSAKVGAEAVVETGWSKALVAGGSRLGWGARAARVMRRSDGGLKAVTSLRTASDSALIGLARTRRGLDWAVGYARGWTSVKPIAVRKRRGGSWSRVGLPKPRGAGAALADVATSGSTDTWVVGFRITTPGRRHPWVLKRSAAGWLGRHPKLAWGERGMLSGVSTSVMGGTWISGWTSRFGSIRPYLAKRTRRSWKRMDLSSLGAAVIVDVDVDDARRGWAVGYRLTSDGTRPLVLRWDGKTWTQRAAPDTGSATAPLTALAVDQGHLTVGGATWSSEGGRFMAYVASHEDGGWATSVLRTMPGDAVITGIDGDPRSSGWAAGSSSRVDAFLLKTCDARPGPAARKQTRRLRRAEAAATSSDVDRLVDGAATDDDVQPPIVLDPAGVPRLKLEPAAGFRMRDRTKAAGLPTSSKTWSGVVADFDGDRRDDIFLGKHGRGTLFLDRGVQFQDAGVDFGKGDRHGCAAADVDGSGLPDLYCTFGAERGTGVKHNQLWLDPGGPDRAAHPTAGGALEPMGRGRRAAFIDADGDGARDLFVGQKPGRPDGLPSPNKLYLRTGPAAFAYEPRSGVTLDIGTHAVDVGDFDRDGRQDLLLVYYDQRAGKPKSGTRLFRNTPAGFKDVSAKLGIRKMGDRDAELVRLDRDGRADLVQLAGNRIRISLQRRGRFVPVFERTISNGVAVATGDIDGDGDMDLYILRQKDRKGQKDVILVNRGNGRSYRAVKAPSRAGGAADDVLAIDHDQNGQTDFLVLNGRGRTKGPLQLIAFYR